MKTIKLSSYDGIDFTAALYVKENFTNKEHLKERINELRSEVADIESVIACAVTSPTFADKGESVFDVVRRVKIELDEHLDWYKDTLHRLFILETLLTQLTFSEIEQKN